MSLSFEINDLPPEENEELMAIFSGVRNGFLHVGPKKYVLPSQYGKQAAGYYNLKLRSDDVWIVTYPRSGTTWTQEMVWLVTNSLDYKRASSEKLTDRCLFLEASILVCESFVNEIIEINNMDDKGVKENLETLRPGYEKADEMKSPRHIKSHLPLSLLPPKLLDTCKVIYVARNPKDVAVSFYHLSRLLNEFSFQGDFKKYWELFQRDMIPWTPFWSHIEEAWKLRNHPNMLFLFYEDMKKDLKPTIHKVAAFFKKSMNDEQVSAMVDHLNFENFSKNPALQQLNYAQKGLLKEGEQGFYRKGKSGEWRAEFTSEMNAKADEWIQEHEKKTDLRFQF